MDRNFGRIVGRAFRQSKDMAPVGQGRNPLVGFAMGVLLGPIGVGLYLQSFRDFLITTMFLIGGSAATGGIAAPVFWLMCGSWAFARIRNSNRAADESRSSSYRSSVTNCAGSVIDVPGAAAQLESASSADDPRNDRQRKFVMPL